MTSQSAGRNWAVVALVLGGAGSALWALAGSEQAVALTTLCLASRPAVEPGPFLIDWSLAPAVTLPLAAALVLYVHGAWRGAKSGAGPSAGQTGCFIGGWVLLAIAIVSPLCRLAAASASGHMVQHALLMALAPPLLVLGAPFATMRLALAPTQSPLESVERRESGAGVGGISLLYGAVIWLAHAPLVYEATLMDPLLHLLALAGLLGTGLYYWHVVLIRCSTGGAMLALFFAMLHTGLLGALLTLAASPWYPVFAGRTAAWGLTALEDQQLAGLLMWVPMGGVYLAAALTILGRTLGRLAADEGGQRIW
jgi:putative membrane protein